ncbi:putative radical SAM superfamily Fe-S cluster-containing enzyme [Sporomusaceae bacterium BoRhaA]|uniref:radical SAM protein n=1 Tax=Pelorhabdus rhamnosifermentans TaxID=2772457 RepID=UPI001C060287|nr:radical SAM protein [Pelorhabdus rhamnosifermentans]MBU2702350.1 putative radical SAM superfamily Fe-S cluster-containing enzyme [Pelorhabdus rhamnosifermentans]
MQLAENTAKNDILDTTKSVCPVCLKVIEAQIVVKDHAVYMKKVCTEHGAFTAYLWPDVDHYQWMKSFLFPCIPPAQPIPSLQSCPQNCGLCSSHLRHPTLVELETTQRCNLRCPVCFMAAGERQASSPPDPELTVFEMMYKDILAKTGPQTSIQLTGGEPTVRKDLPEIVSLGRCSGFIAIEVNTNGMVIAEDPAYLARLVEAGISGIYLQFDGVTKEVYKTIRGQDILAKKLQAIENCREVGIQVVLAMTVISGINDDQMGAVLNFALKNRDVIAGIAYQPAFGSGRFDVAPKRRLSIGDVAFMLSEQSNGMVKPYDFWPLGCSHPLCDAATYLIEDQGVIKPLTSMITPQEYVAYFDPDSPQGSVFPDIAGKMFPEIGPGLSIVMMNFMDARNLDLKKLRECSMTVTGPDGRIVPFCVYQLTDIYGKRKSK